MSSNVQKLEGFVVNVHDSTNFDIDLNPELKESTRVISNEYTYQDFDFIPKWNSESPIKTGTSYRCRLRGVGINQSAQSRSSRLHKTCISVRQLIDRSDGWVTCFMHNVDIYNRLLVDIIVNTSTGPVDVREFILSQDEMEHSPLFYRYFKKIV